MADKVLPHLKQAFEHGNECYMDLDAVIDELVKVQEALPEQDTEMQASVAQMLDKVFEFQDTWSAFLKDLQELRFKYRASYMPSQNPPEVDELIDVLARIEARRRGLGPKQE